MKIKEIITEDIFDADPAPQPPQREPRNKKSESNYLLDQWNFTAKKLNRLCSNYISAIGGLEQAVFTLPLFRGINIDDLSNQHNVMNIIDTRTDRMPKDTPPETQILLDNYFKVNTGYAFRSAGLFVIGNPNETDAYGIRYRVLPMGEFHYCWSKHYRDMYEEFDSYIEAIYPDVKKEPFLGTKNRIRKYLDTQDKVNGFLDQGNYQFDTGLQTAIQSKHEIMIVCKQAVILDDEWIRKVEYALMHKKELPGSTEGYEI